MPVKPKFSAVKSQINEFEKQFTDREELIKEFKNILNSLPSAKITILNYFGIGGIGKSTLIKEFKSIANKKYPSSVIASLDFDLNIFREPEIAIYSLRKELNDKNKIEFPSFDIAYSVYWQKTHPQIAFTKENIPFFEEGSIVSNLLSSVGGIPVIGLIPVLTDAFKKGKKFFKDWWTKRGQKELSQLPSLSAKEILDRLPMFLAFDINDYLNKKNTKAVIFIDTYEALWENIFTEGGFFLRDEWVRELIANLPQVLWVISGREKLRFAEVDSDWNDVVIHNSVNNFTEDDTRSFLKSCKISDTSVQEIITKASKGIPYYLDLAVDTYYLVQEKFNRNPQPDDFASNNSQVLNRFLRYLDKSEIETLKLLSVPRFWDYDLFKKLVSEFKTSYPVSAFNNLNRFSFIRVNENSNIPDNYTMQELMRKGLYESLSDKLKYEIHKFLFEHYNEKLTKIDSKNISDAEIISLNEAFYHAKNFLNLKDFYDWFSNIAGVYNYAAKWNIILPLYEESIAILKPNLNDLPEQYSNAVIRCSSIMYNLGNFKTALSLIESNFDIIKNSVPEESPSFTAMLNTLATNYYYLGMYDKSKEIYLKAIDLRKKVFGENHRKYADVIDNLAVLYNKAEEYEKSIELHLKAIDIYKNTLGENHIDYADALNNLGHTYYFINKHTECLNLYLQAKEIYIKNLGTEHPKYAMIMHSLGEFYFFMENLDKASEYFIVAYNLRKKLFGDYHFHTVFSRVYLISSTLSENNLNESEKSLLESIETFKSILGENHSYLGYSYYSLARLKFMQEEYSQAKDLMEKTKSIYSTSGVHAEKNIKEINDYLKVIESKLSEKN
ncbi:MAG TPA: tetratricopeptide repeat protein [Ignavibacteria bacterium]|nr:tetratricopeptide repeat protein [Ignavibacteria bacterium]